MAIKFILMVNKQGQTRLANYYDWLTIEERSALEAEIIRKCLSRTEMQCSFMEYRGMKVVYRRYASLFFIVGVEAEEEVRPAAATCPHRGAERPAQALQQVRVVPCRRGWPGSEMGAHSIAFPSPCVLPRRMSWASWSSSTPSWRRWTSTLRTCASWTSCSTWKRRTSSSVRAMGRFVGTACVSGRRPRAPATIYWPARAAEPGGPRWSPRLCFYGIRCIIAPRFAAPRTLPHL
jgi:hypothetical protein